MKKKLRIKIKSSGFSLIELLISLIIISLIISAFMPVMTKKLKKDYVVNNNNSNYKCSGIFKK